MVELGARNGLEDAGARTSLAKRTNKTSSGLDRISCLSNFSGDSRLEPQRRLVRPNMHAQSDASALRQIAPIKLVIWSQRFELVVWAVISPSLKFKDRELRLLLRAQIAISCRSSKR